MKTLFCFVFPAFPQASPVENPALIAASEGHDMPKLNSFVDLLHCWFFKSFPISILYLNNKV